MARNTPKTGQYRDGPVWLASPKGAVNEAPVGPAIRIAVTERYLPEEDPPVSLGFSSSVFFLPIGAKKDKEWERITTEEESAFEVKQAHAALTRGLTFARDHVASLLMKSSDPQAIYALLCTINDDGRECVRANRGASQKTFHPLSSREQALAISILEKHFPTVFRNLNVAFRIREETVDGEPVAWKKGRDFNGNDLSYEGRCEKVSSEKRQLLKASLGFAPHFLITLDSTAWGAYTEEQKARLLYHEISHIGYDAEKDTWFVAEHDIEEFKGVVLNFGLGSNANQRTFQFFNDCQQLSLLGEESEAPRLNTRDILQRVADEFNKQFPDSHAEVL